MEARGDSQCRSAVADHLRNLAAEVAELKTAGGEDLTDTLAHWLSAQYVAVVRQEVDDAVAWAEQSPYPEPSTLEQDVLEGQ